MVIKKMAESNTTSVWDYGKNLVSCINVLMLQAISAVTVFVGWMAVQYNVSQSLMLHICLTTVGVSIITNLYIVLLKSKLLSLF